MTLNSDLADCFCVILNEVKDLLPMMESRSFVALLLRMTRKQHDKSEFCEVIIEL